ncbi:MAG TPA: acyl-CoA dehydrogenase [Desulfobacteraceae bacterium]|nr:acyl-CoA dehydrogenase [Desulfobacteraceae bacterium]
MAQLIADSRDGEFILYDLLGADKLTEHEKYADFSKKSFDLMIAEARKLALKEVLPTLAEGDRKGVRFDQGKVTVPEGFHRAREAVMEAGFTSVIEDPDWGGQGLPYQIAFAIMEYVVGANYALSGYTHMGHGTGKMIELYGTDKLKNLFLEKLYTAEWGGTMLLTEPEAGSDVGALTTTAKRNDDGTWSISGNKIFITAGEHDMTENIVHPVLARIEGAPAGSKGISIFIVPKIWVNEDGSLGEANDVACTGTEEKMGLHGSATCAMALGSKGKCRGFLLGEENRGLEIMFHMMNEARLNVGFQGSSAASMAYLYALDYARSRKQGKRLSDIKNPDAPSAPIIAHPDVRRMMTWMKSHVDGMRTLIFYVASLFDTQAVSEDPKEVARASDLIELLTPVVKAYCAERGFEVCVQAVQTFGGYGYTREYPVEQLLRDAKIASIYEGTDGIQAMDLLGRKLGMKKGMVFAALMEEMNAAIAQARDFETLSPMADALDKAVRELGATAMDLGMTAMSERFETAFAHASPFLEITGDVVMGWLHLRRAVTAEQKLAAAKKKADQVFYGGIVTCARFFIDTVLPVTQGKMASVRGLSSAALDMDDKAFG